MNIESLKSGRGPVCESVLRDLPEWFGIEEAIVQYVADVERMETWVARSSDGALAGFLALHRHFPETAEIHVMGVRRPFHRQGVGRLLVDAAFRHVRETAGRLLTVKTLSASRPSPEYDRTRRFYLALGFLPVEEFPALWGPANPCLLLARPV